MYYCSYYQARVTKEKTWFLVSTLRSFEHIAFDRTLNVEEGIFEFFVPQQTEQYFVELMNYLKGQGIVVEITKLPNRLVHEDVLA